MVLFCLQLSQLESAAQAVCPSILLTSLQDNDQTRTSMHFVLCVSFDRKAELQVLNGVCYLGPRLISCVRDMLTQYKSLFAWPTYSRKIRLQRALDSSRASQAKTDRCAAGCASSGLGDRLRSRLMLFFTVVLNRLTAV